MGSTGSGHVSFSAALRNKQFGGHDVVRKDVTTKTKPEQRTLNTDGSASSGNAT